MCQILGGGDFYIDNDNSWENSGILISLSNLTLLPNPFLKRTQQCFMDAITPVLCILNIRYNSVKYAESW